MISDPAHIRDGRRVPWRLRTLLYAGTCAFTLLCHAHANAQTVQVRSMLGTPGFLDMPNARMARDGELAVGLSFLKNTQHYNFSFQALPWLEGSLIYSGIEEISPLYSVYYDRSFAFKARLWDETEFWPAVALGVNDVIGTGIYGGEYLVASKRFGNLDTAIGIGWGRFASANRIDNPLGLISDSFRRNRTVADPGATNFGELFRGIHAGIFAGVTWYTPIEGLALSAEYSSDEHTLETQTNTLPAVQWPVNIGLTYQVWDTLSFSLNWLYGNSVAGAFTYQINPVQDPYPQRVGPDLPAFRVRSAEEQARALAALQGKTVRSTYTSLRTSETADGLWSLSDSSTQIAIEGRRLVMTVAGGDVQAICRRAAMMAAELHLDEILVRSGSQRLQCQVTPTFMPIALASTQPGAKLQAPAQPVVIDARQNAPRDTSNAAVAAKLRSSLAAQSINVQAIGFGPGEITVYYYNSTYFHENDAVDRIIRVLTSTAPTDAERFNMIAVVSGVAQRQYTVLRGPLERTIEARADTSPDAVSENSVAPMTNRALTDSNRTSYPRFQWALAPQFRQQLFDPDNPFGMQLLANLSAMVEVLPGLSFQGSAEASLVDNFNVNRPSDSVLPHVRTDFVTYFTRGKNGIPNLDGAYRFRLSPEVFGIVRGGYLESMFAGVGGEVLWRPEGARWALGGSLYAVQQRNYDRLFGLQNYKVLTGHISLYYASPWYDLQFALRSGQYLAGDRGLTLEVTRRFASGVEIGVFATKTNVSSAQFGEGSFDKGFRIRFPLGWIVPLNTQSEFGMDIRPVQRDGGQRLQGDALLFDETRRTSQAEAMIGR